MGLKSEFFPVCFPNGLSSVKQARYKGRLVASYAIKQVHVLVSSLSKPSCGAIESASSRTVVRTKVIGSVPIRGLCPTIVNREL